MAHWLLFIALLFNWQQPPTDLWVEVDKHMPTYFGLCDSAGNPSYSVTDNTGGSYYIWSLGTEAEFTCPGSGNQVIKELSAMVHVNSVSVNMRCAIYSADGSTLIAQGAAEVAVAGASDTWQGHLTQASITPNPATVVGGTKYILSCAFSRDAGTSHCNGNNVGKYASGDKTGGFTAPLPAGSAGYHWPTRCGVDAEAAGGLSIPVEIPAGMNRGMARGLLRTLQ